MGASCIKNINRDAQKSIMGQCADWENPFAYERKICDIAHGEKKRTRERAIGWFVII
jgi:hypothetical protein